MFDTIDNLSVDAFQRFHCSEMFIGRGHYYYYCGAGGLKNCFFVVENFCLFYQPKLKCPKNPNRKLVHRHKKSVKKVTFVDFSKLWVTGDLNFLSNFMTEPVYRWMKSGEWRRTVNIVEY